MEKIRRRVLPIAAALIAAACGATSSGPSEDAALPVTRLSAGPQSFTYNSGLTESRRTVVRDAAAWRDMWTAIWRSHSPEPALPSIDFAREMVVVAALGARPTGGYSIFIDAASENASGVAIQIRSASPGPGCAVTLAMTNPVDIARLPRRMGPVTFVEKQETVDCR
jgi:hypothetical protein